MHYFITWLTQPVQISLTPQTIITASGLLAAIVAIVALFAKGVRWVDRQKQQSADIEALRTDHNRDIESLNKEQTLIITGLLACLKGLKEQGCNGQVTVAIQEIETYLNQKAHQ